MSEIKVNKITPKQNCTQVTLGDSGDDIVVATGVNLKTAAVKDAAGNVIVSRCGSNITIGSSGASIALACGASQTGFGRTGTVDWDTTAKTASFTAVSGNGYFVNTTSGAITVTLPAGSAGDIVGISDYASTFQTNNVTITPNGTDKINGVNANATLSTQGLAVSLVYVDSTRGWKSVTGSDNDTTGIPPAFVTATGGTVTCCGDYKIHTFTGPGTFTVSCAGNPFGSDTVDYLVIAGGGGGGEATPLGVPGGAGGAGGYRESSGAASGCYTASPLGACVSALPVSASTYPVTVGGGGSPETNGSNSVFSTITSTGGGGGGGGSSGTGGSGNSGGSGGGGGSSSTNPAQNGSGGTGNTPPTSPSQGNNGGNGSAFQGHSFGSGAGGGAGGAGNPGGPGTGGTGGVGATSSINGTPTGRAGGGGGAGRQPLGGCGTAGPASDGGGSGGNAGGGQQSGTANTGGGGGGNAFGSAGATSGGSGIVIIRYKFQ